jgi:hypothetical protein
MRHGLPWISFGWVASYRDICCPDRDNTLTVKRQCSNSGPASGRQAHEQETIGRPDKVVIPHMLPGVEQRDHGTALGVSGCYLDCLPAIAMKAR